MQRGSPFLVGLLAAVACACFAGLASAQGSLTMTNATGGPVNVWLMARGKAWSQPVFLPRSGDVRAPLESPGDYYVVVRDIGQAEDHLGWYDFHRLVRDVPGAKLSLTGGHLAVQRQATQLVQTSVPVLRESLQAVWEPVPIRGFAGCVRYRYVLRYRPVMVVQCETVYQQTAVVYTETIFKVTLRATSSGGEIDLGRYRVVEGPMP